MFFIVGHGLSSDGQLFDFEILMQLANIQIDLDGAWVLQQCIGEKIPYDPDFIYQEAIPVFLDLFDKHEVKATFFVNTIDLSIPFKRKYLKDILAKGHELANHGHHHFFLNHLSPQAKREELKKSTDLLNQFTGEQVQGFRAAGYDMDTESLSILEQLGYCYDSSVLPTSFTPIIKLWEKLFAGRVTTPLPALQCLKCPIIPYHPSCDNIYQKGISSLLEVPITTTPAFRFPFHFSYGAMLGRSYQMNSLKFTKWFDIPISFLFHLIDGLEFIHDPKFKAFQFRSKFLKKKISLMEEVIIFLKNHYHLKTVSEFCRTFSGNC